MGIGILTQLMTNAWRRFRAERRLLAKVTALAFGAGVLMYLRHYDLMVLGMPLPLFTGLFYAAFIGSAASVTLAVLPGLRAMIEAVAISRLGVAAAACGMPEFGTKLIASPILGATVVILGAIAVKHVMRVIPALARSVSANTALAPVPAGAGQG